MNYMISLDGGGTKVCCLISDESGMLCGAGLGGPVNSTFNRPEEIESSISQAIQSALLASNLSGKLISDVYCAMPVAQDVAHKAIAGSLHERVNVRFVAEFTMSLYAAIQKEIGALALAGTGSFAFAQTGKRFHLVGGYGSLFSDEGSGYDIGRRAITCCLHMLDEIGPNTLLYEHVRQSLERLNLNNIVDIYTLSTGEQRRFIASVCKLVGHCARQGDEVSLGILREAAERIAFQTNGVLAKCGPEAAPGFPVTVAGGVWKAHPVIFDTFMELVKRQHPQVNIVAPLFEPVVGGILLGLKERNASVFLSQLTQIYSEFLYPSII